MNTSASDMRCILCDTPLAGQNRQREHAIPRGIGGRIVSDAITCSSCNNKAGSTSDRDLCECYFIVTGTLSEFLPTESDTIGNTSGIAILRDQGREFRAKIPLDPERSANGTYVATERSSGQKRVIGADAESALGEAERIGRSLYGEGRFRIEAVPAPCLPVYEKRDVPLPQSISVQCGALKAGFLTLAALKAESHGVDLWSEQFDTARATIKAVDGTSLAEGQVCVPTLPKSKIGVSLGLHQELLPSLLQIRQLITFPRTDFEHFITLSGNAASQSLELFVVVFSAHVFAFRLANDWQGGDIVLVAANGILRNSSYSSLSRCRVSPFSATQRNSPMGQSGSKMENSILVPGLYARAKAYQFRHSEQFQRIIICDEMNRFGTLAKTLSKILEMAYPSNLDAPPWREQRAAMVAKATSMQCGAALTDTQTKQAAELIAEAIDNLAKEGIFPSSYGQGVIDRHVGE